MTPASEPAKTTRTILIVWFMTGKGQLAEGLAVRHAIPMRKPRKKMPPAMAKWLEFMKRKTHRLRPKGKRWEQ